MNNIKHTFNYLVGSIGIKALGFISIPFFTHYLSVEEFGIMNLYSTVLVFLSTLLGLGILGSFKRYYFEKNNDFGSFLFSNILFLILFFALFLLFYFYFINDISNFIKIPINILKYAVFVAFLSLLVKIKLDLLQIKEESQKNIILEFIQALILLVLSICFISYLNTNKFYGRIYGDLIGYGILSIYSIYKLLNFLEFKFNLKYIKYSLLFGLPVLPSMFSSFGLSFADKLMINNYTNAKDVGIYSFAAMIALLIQVIIGAIGKSWQPLFYKALTNKKYLLLDQVFKTNSKIVFAASLFLIMFSYEFVYVLAPSEYLKSLNIITYLIIGFDFFFLYTAYGQYVSYSKKTYIYSIITFISVLLNIILNYIFIPKYGYESSAIATLISYFLMFVMFYFNAKYILKFKIINIFIIYKIVLSYSILLLIFYSTKFIIHSHILLLFFKMVILGVYFAYNYQDYIVKIINKGK